MICGNIDLTCTACRLSEARTQVVPGNGSCKSRIMFIGEAPGREEDLRGEPFVGRAGVLLNKTLDRFGIKRNRVYVGNIVKCRPPKNRKPRTDEIDTCTTMYLVNEIETIGPKVICALGQTAVSYFLPIGRRMADVIGREYFVVVSGRKIRFFPTYHPAACLYQRKNLSALQKDIRSSLKAAGMMR